MTVKIKVKEKIDGSGIISLSSDAIRIILEARDILQMVWEDMEELRIDDCYDVFEAMRCLTYMEKSTNGKFIFSNDDEDIY